MVYFLKLAAVQQTTWRCKPIKVEAYTKEQPTPKPMESRIAPIIIREKDRRTKLNLKIADSKIKYTKSKI